MAVGCVSAKSIAQIPVPVPASRTRWRVGGSGHLVVVSIECDVFSIPNYEVFIK